MFCAQCGQLVAEGMKFCPHCGTPVAVAPPSQASEAALAAGTAPQPNAEAATQSDAGAAAATLVARVKAILLTPSTAWPVIAAEPSSPGAIYGHYVAPLAAIGVIAALIGHTLIGYNVPLLGHVRTGIVAGLGTAVLGYLLSFVSVFVIAWLVDMLAPSFGGQRDGLRALKLTAYSYTPAWVAGILQLVPALGVLALLAGCYGLYLLYLGLPVLMRCPKEKSVGYTIVLILCAIVVSVVIGENPTRWFVIECGDQKLAVLKWDLTAANSPTARHFCGEAHAQVYISRWFESICAPPKSAVKAS